MSVDLSNTNTKILKADFKDIINRVNKYITQGGEDSKGKISDDRNIYIDYPSNTKHIKYKTYKILKTNWDNFIKAYGREPNYVTINPTVTSTTKNCYNNPRYYSGTEMKQETNYYCGVNVTQQTLYSITGKYYSESYLAKLLGTTKNGTGPNEILNVIKKLLTGLGYNVKKCQWENFSKYTWKQVGEMLENPKVSIVFHDIYRLKYGHYEVASRVCLSSKVVTILNSLSGGYIENRSFNTMEAYINAYSGKSLLIVEVA